MVGLGLLTSLSPSTAIKLVSGQTPKVEVPSLADLRSMIPPALSSLPSYSSDADVFTKPINDNGTSKPIPRVNLNPATNALHNSQQTNTIQQHSNHENANISSWFSGLTSNVQTNSPPPSYNQDIPPPRFAIENVAVGGQLFEQQMRRGQEMDVDQGRNRLLRMQRFKGDVQGRIPGEQVYKERKEGQMMIEDVNVKDGPKKSWLDWFKCGV